MGICNNKSRQSRLDIALNSLLHCQLMEVLWMILKYLEKMGCGSDAYPRKTYGSLDEYHQIPLSIIHREYLAFSNWIQIFPMEQVLRNYELPLDLKIYLEDKSVKASSLKARKNFIKNQLVQILRDGYLIVCSERKCMCRLVIPSLSNVVKSTSGFEFVDERPNGH